MKAQHDNRECLQVWSTADHINSSRFHKAPNMGKSDEKLRSSANLRRASGLAVLFHRVAVLIIHPPAIIPLCPPPLLCSCLSRCQKH